MKSKLSQLIVVTVASIMLVLGAIFATPLPAAAGSGSGGGIGGIFTVTPAK